MLYADVIIDISVASLDRTFQYRIPPELTGKVRIGSPVRIPFGRGNASRKGYIVGISETPKFPPERTKDIAEVPERELTIEDRMVELAYWMRGEREHLFFKASDENGKVWRTTDLGALLRITEPKISVLPSGEVITLHRATQDAFIRTVFWSLPEAFEFQEHEQMLDPEVAATARVKELYQDTGGVAPVKKAWWKFW